MARAEISSIIVGRLCARLAQAERVKKPSVAVSAEIAIPVTKDDLLLPVDEFSKWFLKIPMRKLVQKGVAQSKPHFGVQVAEEFDGVRVATSFCDGFFKVFVEYMPLPVAAQDVNTDPDGFRSDDQAGAVTRVDTRMKREITPKTKFATLELNLGEHTVEVVLTRADMDLSDETMLERWGRPALMMLFERAKIDLALEYAE